MQLFNWIQKDILRFLAFLHFSGTNPQSLRLTLLNANGSQALRVAIRYTTPQRLDVYRTGAFIFPTNANFNEENFSYKKKDPKLPDNQFEPTLNSISGANYYDRESHLLYVVVKGNVPVDIRTAPVVQVKLGEYISYSRQCGFRITKDEIAFV